MKMNDHTSDAFRYLGDTVNRNIRDRMAGSRLSKRLEGMSAFSESLDEAEIIIDNPGLVEPLNKT